MLKHGALTSTNLAGPVASPDVENTIKKHNSYTLWNTKVIAELTMFCKLNITVYRSSA